ncbi:hypothetical protein TKK_0015620 [Trichogramma kaykai]
MAITNDAQLSWLNRRKDFTEHVTSFANYKFFDRVRTADNLDDMIIDDNAGQDLSIILSFPSPKSTGQLKNARQEPPSPRSCIYTNESCYTSRTGDCGATCEPRRRPHHHRSGVPLPRRCRQLHSRRVPADPMPRPALPQLRPSSLQSAITRSADITAANKIERTRCTPAPSSSHVKPESHQYVQIYIHALMRKEGPCDVAGRRVPLAVDEEEGDKQSHSGQLVAIIEKDGELPSRIWQQSRCSSVTTMMNHTRSTKLTHSPKRVRKG